MTTQLQTIREGRLLALPDGFGGVDLVVLPRIGVDRWPLGTLDRPYVERCEGCDGTRIAHAGDMLVGPCSSCHGLGEVLMAWSDDGGYQRVICLPAIIGTPYIHQARTAGIDLR